MRSYRPEELFDERGRFVAELAALAPTGDRRMGANPHANGGRAAQPLDAAATSQPYAIDGRRARRRCVHESTRAARRDAARHLSRRTRRRFRLFCPDETNSNRLGAVFEVEKRCFVEPTIADRRSRLRRRPRDGGAERAQLRGLARGLRAHRPPRRCSRRTRRSRWSSRRWRRSTRSGSRRAAALPWRAPVPSLNYPADVDVLAQRPQRVQPPGPGLHGHDRCRRRARSRASTCRPTRTACCRSPTTACAARTT